MPDNSHPPFPDCFYYTLPDSEAHFTWQPTGNRFIASRYIKRLPPYQESRLARRKIPKTLILSDWRRTHYTQLEHEQLRDIIERLLQEGFNVVLRMAYGTPFRPLTRDTLHVLQTADNFDLPSSEDVQKAAAEYLDCPAHLLHVLDDREIDRLVAGAATLGPRRLRMRHALYDSHRIESQTSSHLSELYSARLKTLLNNAHSSFETLHLSPWERVFEARLPPLPPALRMEEADTAFCCEYGELAQSPVENPCLSRELRVWGKLPGGETPAFPALQHLRFHETHNLRFEHFLALTSGGQLESLRFDHDSIPPLPDTLSLPEDCYRRLNTLKMARNVRLGFALLQQCADTLQHLEMAPERDADFIPGTPMLPSLESLHWDKAISPTPFRILNILLKAAPHIRHLHLADPNVEKNLLDVLNSLDTEEPLPLSALKTLRLNLARLTLTTLDRLFQRATMLEHLSLDGIGSTFSLHDLKNIPMRLKTLFLSGGQAEDNAITLLRATLSAPELHTITLDLARFNPKKIPSLLQQFRAKKPAALKQLTLKGLEHFSESDLRRLTAACPGLQSLDLRDCRFDAASIPADVFPPHLRVSLPTKRPRAAAQTSAGREGAASSTPSPVSDINRPFNTEHLFRFKPCDETFAFRYEGTQQSLKQAMVIEKLSQYLTLKNRDTACIHRLQDGICDALSRAFLEHTDWNTFLSRIQTWDGCLGTLTPALSADFDMLYGYVMTCQLSRPTLQTTPRYLGERIQSFIEKHPHPRILHNPWHTIAIRPLPHQPDNQVWELYDPESPEGARSVQKDALHTEILKALGPLVTAETRLPRPHAPHALKAPSLFLKKGGLLALIQHPTLWENVQAQLTRHRWPLNALTGILLRDVRGKPAWFRALTSGRPALASFARSLVDALLSFPDTSTRFQQSLECLSAGERQLCINAFSRSLLPHAEQAISCLKALNTSENPFLHVFSTWKEHQAAHPTPGAFFEEALSPGVYKKHLITGHSAHMVKALAFALEKQCIDTGRPVFYVNSPQDLVCSADTIVRGANQQGHIQNAPSGPLYDFLQRHRHEHPVILVNYDNFEVDELVRFNTLLDKIPLADGTSLPRSSAVIGLLNRNRPECYQGGDFYGRFQRIDAYPFPESTLKDAIPPLTCRDATPEEASRKDVLRLFHAPDWKERLLGNWALNGDTLPFREGLLQAALAKGSCLHIGQGLWESPEFNRFWEEARLRGYILHEGQRIHIPPDLSFVRHTTYPFASLRRFLQPAAAPSSAGASSTDATASPKILNSGMLAQFLTHDSIRRGRVWQQPGWVETHKNRTLPVYLTRALSEDEWAMLLYECEKWDVQLEVRRAPNVTLPEALDCVPPPHPQALTPWDGRATQAVTVIHSTDPDTTIARLEHSGERWRVLDISECTEDDLLERVSATTGKGQRFHFSKTRGALLQGLAEGQNILLRGHCSETLADRLAPLLCSHSGRPRIAIVTENPLHFLPAYTHAVQPGEKMAFLPPAHRARLHDFAEKEPLATLKARSRFLTQQRGTDSNHLFQGLEGHVPIPPLPPLNLAASAHEAEQVIIERRARLSEALRNTPFVFVTGLSGVGKSTFIREAWPDAEHLLFEDMEAWLSADGPLEKALLLDEAMLARTDWSIFEGVFANPPGILYKGVWRPLSPTHKIIFVDNPESYGHGRHIPNLYRRHGNGIVFHPLPPAFLYERVVKPLLEPDFEPLAHHFLDVYTALTALSTTDVLITPRELEMMALLTRATLAENPALNPQDVARHYAFLLAEPLVPAAHKTAFARAFKPQTPLPLPLPAMAPGFILTPSRLAVSRLLQDLLTLRRWRQALPEGASHAHRFGGLNSFILGGSPGVGKSELVAHQLIAEGLEERKSHQVLHAGTFIRLNPSASIEQKKVIILRAFLAGAVVVADEINSSPLMEAFLNDLLMGKTPGINTSPTPGFLLIGMQNSAAMGGRLTISPALSHRMIHCTLPDYPDDEIATILRTKHLEEDDITAIVTAFKIQLQTARAQRKKPEPGMREILKAADICLEGYKNRRIASASTSTHTGSPKDADILLKTIMKRAATATPATDGARFFASAKPLAKRSNTLAIIPGTAY